MGGGGRTRRDSNVHQISNHFTQYSASLHVFAMEYFTFM
jgi:hypothetical protein